MFNILQAAWKYLAPKIPGSDNIMSKAMEVGQRTNSPAAIMEVLESIAHQMGKGEVLNNNQIWNSFKTRSPQEIIPHAEKMLRESGKFGAVMNFFGNSNKGDNQ